MVFKIAAVSRPNDSAFEGRGLEVLGETQNYTYFVMAHDEGAALGRALNAYVTSGALRSFFDNVEDIEQYGPEDRQGPGIDASVAGFEGNRIFDVVIWPADTYPEAVSRVGALESALGDEGSIELKSVSARRTVLRVSASTAGLHTLLLTDVVETVRTPPVPFQDFRDWREAALPDIEVRRFDSAVVGVLDDSPHASHPLLDGLILSDDWVGPPSYAWQQRGSHGTEVVGRTLFPRLQANLRDLEPIEAYGSVRVARVLESDPAAPGEATRFPSFALPHDLVERSVRFLHGEHGVRVFNLSIGYAEPFSTIHVGPLTETLDELARELDVVIVVPTGNAPVDINGRTASGHHIISDRPHYRLAPEHRLAEPAPAALAVTVGSIALSGAPAELPGRLAWQAASEAHEASPFSRSGPGLGTRAKRANKPDLTHFGGNVVLSDVGHAVLNDPGASVVTTSLKGGDGRLFAAVNGTSFAAPRVARIAADIVHEYPDASANLVRALLVSSARPTAPATQVTDAIERASVYGSGLPDRERALASAATRVTMTYDGDMGIDSVQIHPFPVPEVFRRGSGGQRTISVALAFDPPVRRQRREYIAGSMKLDIYRDIDPTELAEMLRKQDPDDPADLISDRRRLKLSPGSHAVLNSTLQFRRWTARHSFVNDDETFYLVVTHSAQTWARDGASATRQRYAVAVTLEDQNLVQLDLHQILTQQVRLPARVRFGE